MEGMDGDRICDGEAKSTGGEESLGAERFRSPSTRGGGCCCCGSVPLGALLVLVGLFGIANRPLLALPGRLREREAGLVGEPRDADEGDDEVVREGEDDEPRGVVLVAFAGDWDGL